MWTNKINWKIANVNYLMVIHIRVYDQKLVVTHKDDGKDNQNLLVLEDKHT